MSELPCPLEYSWMCTASGVPEAAFEASSDPAAELAVAGLSCHQNLEGCPSTEEALHHQVDCHAAVVLSCALLLWP